MTPSRDTPPDPDRPGVPRPVCGVLPPYLVERLGWSETLRADERIRARRAALAPGAPAAAAGAAGAAWTVHTAAGTTDLPGDPVRVAGGPASGDPAVDEAASGITAALALFDEVYGRNSYDGAGAPVLLTVHFGRDYANAFWDGTQLVFGDGDGEVFTRFTASVDVLAHELTHAVIERTAGLVYRDQPGALNESVADVFAACAEQRLRGQSAAEADWLIGSDLFLPGVAARGLRDMAAPGTAYDDPRLGRDPQPAHLEDLVVTADDHGGVHLNSGIPNRAFQLAATAIGGTSWEGAGRIWYAALTGGAVRPTTDFAGFAAATVAAAGSHAEEVRGAWSTVGVEPWATGTTCRVRVRRSGGFVGTTVEGETVLDPDDDRVGALRTLVGPGGPAGRSPGPPVPDGFSYEVEVDGERRLLSERDLTPVLREVVELALRPEAPPTR